MDARINDVTNPKHYTELSPEPIDVIENWGLDYHLGSVLAYVARAGYKEGSSEIEDLKKARWFLQRKIDLIHEQQVEAEQISSDLGSGVNPLPSLLDKAPKWLRDLASPISK